MRFSVIIPTIGRPSLQEAKNSVKDADEIIVVADDLQNRREQVTIINEGFKQATGDILVYCGERMEFHPDWKIRIFQGLEHIEHKDGVVSFRENIVTAGAVTRNFFETVLQGYWYWPDYIHYCADIELGERARRAMRYREEQGVILIEKTKPEQTNISIKAVAFDEKTFALRMALGLPDRRVVSDEERVKHI